MQGRVILGGMCASMISAAIIMSICLDKQQGPITEHYSEYNIEYSRYTVTSDKYLSGSVERKFTTNAVVLNSAAQATSEPIEEVVTQTVKVACYGVYIDGSYVGVVSDKEPIEQFMQELRNQYSDDETVIKVLMNHDITFTDIEMEPDLIDNDVVYNILSGLENETEYVEVAPGDSIQGIADKYGKTLEDIYSYPWLWDGEIVESAAENFKVGLLILVPTDKNYIRPIITKQEYVQQEKQYETETLNDETLPQGYLQVVTQGQCGVEEVVMLSSYDGDTLLESEVLSTRTEVEPVKEVLLVGTKPNTAMAEGDGGSGTYFYPIESSKAKISAYMGDGRGHKGIDIAAPRGTEIYAACDGVVSKVNYKGWGGGYGIHILIDNDDGKQCMYAHMSYTAVGIKEGDTVKAGQLIGYVGSTGDSSGNHLHFEVRSGDSFKNPLNYVKKPE